MCKYTRGGLDILCLTEWRGLFATNMYQPYPTNAPEVDGVNKYKRNISKSMKINISNSKNKLGMLTA